MSGHGPQDESPFHVGEQLVQERAGVNPKVERRARRIVHDHLPDRHRSFYGGLPFVVLGMADRQNRPWASLVPGRPGFVTSPDAGSLDIGALPRPGDPLRDAVKPGADIGVLGIDLATRRRTRISGRIGHVRPDGFIVTVKQAFGNCPQYIQVRAVTFLSEPRHTDSIPPDVRSDRFDGWTRALIEGADTLFVATAYADDREAVSQGADVSHRGGKPGFVLVEDDRTFVLPDYAGNSHFNTLGNIALNPKAGFLFIDFDTGGLVSMTGEAEIVWGGNEVQTFTGAARSLRFRVEEVVRTERGLPLRFRNGASSSDPDRTATGRQAKR